MTELLTSEEITEYARGIMTNQMLVADLDDPAWRSSLALLISGLDAESVRDVGMVLVPLEPHQNSSWFNGVAPGCTFSAVLVHNDSIPAIRDEYIRMAAALYPQSSPE